MDINLAQHGIGGYDSSEAIPRQQYCLLDRKYTYTYTMCLAGMPVNGQ
ncbi:hypothetical protein [Mucilaginibacter sp. CSA2-8R]